jgi:hypothetical protein
MKKFVGLLAAGAIAIVLVAAAKPADAARRHSLDGRSNSFDGIWSVLISTSSGSCNSYRVSVRIVGGRVEGGAGDYSLDGSVSSSGGAVVTVSNSMGSAVGYGRLRGTSGGGWWRTSGGECEGSWGASRRG